MAALISIYRLALGPDTVPWRPRRARPYTIPRSFKFFTSGHQGLGPHDHIYTLPLGPCALRTQAHGPLMLHLWGPLKYYQTFHHAHGRPHHHLYITLGAGPSIYTPPEGVSLRDSRVFLVTEYKERGGLGGIAPWLIPPIPPGPFTRAPCPRAA